jgi:hypothetical protein
MRYEAPAIEGRAAVGGPLIQTAQVGSPLPPSPAWRRDDTGDADDAR